MRISRELLEQREGKGFKDVDEVYEFASQLHCFIRAYSPANHCYYYVNHLGELLNKASWYSLYNRIMYYTYEDAQGKLKKVQVGPERFTDISDARTIGERDDGMRKPLFYRNYFIPRGFYDDVRGTFNVARPLRYFAKRTGADISYIYTFLQHIAGVNYIYVLAWLREKMMNPMRKTEVVPVFVSKEQGTGKTTFGEVICKAMFEEENVLVTDQYDSGARFNADYADALIVCLEEKKQDDKRNDASTLKSRVTATQIRKEQKGIDPIYQESYTDFIMTTNGEVPIKFDSMTQRRFMVIEVDDNFTRANPLADEVFTKLYGFNANGTKVEKGFRNDPQAIQQFKWELLNNEQVANTNPRDFVRTDAYERCFTMPRTNEAIEVEAILKGLVPFIKESLINRCKIEDVSIPSEEGDIAISLDSLGPPEAFIYVRQNGNEPDRIAVNRLLMFADQFNQKPYAHSVVERAILDLKKWFRKEHGILILGKTEPPSGGFRAVSSRARMSPTVWFVLDGSLDIQEEVYIPVPTVAEPIEVVKVERIGERMRYNEVNHLPDPNGTVETLNELKPGAGNRGKDNAQYLDTFLLESDETSVQNKRIEDNILSTGIDEIEAESLYALRLKLQKAEAERLFNEGIVARVVYSGAKSYHMIVRVEPAPETLDERRWLFAYLCKTLSNKLVFDPQVGDPTRLTRAPITATRVTMKNNVRVIGTQKLIYENWDNVYKLDWKPMYQAWIEQPKDNFERKGKSMLPTKEIYRDAARALIEGSFFNDNRWNGKRQNTFFCAYRIVRALGYTKEQIFDEVDEQMSSYYKIEDREYWKSRRDSEIIRQIEADMED